MSVGHSIILQISIAHLLCPRHCSRSWEKGANPTQIPAFMALIETGEHVSYWGTSAWAWVPFEQI